MRIPLFNFTISARSDPVETIPRMIDLWRKIPAAAYACEIIDAVKETGPHKLIYECKSALPLSHVYRVFVEFENENDAVKFKLICPHELPS